MRQLAPRSFARAAHPLAVLALIVASLTGPVTPIAAAPIVQAAATRMPLQPSL